MRNAYLRYLYILATEYPCDKLCVLSNHAPIYVSNELPVTWIRRRVYGQLVHVPLWFPMVCTSAIELCIVVICVL